MCHWPSWLYGPGYWALINFSRVNLGQMKVSRPLRVAKLLIVFKN